MVSTKRYLLRRLGSLFGGAAPAKPVSPFVPASVAEGTIPDGMAMDSVLEESGALAMAEKLFAASPDDLQRFRFLGYPRLATLQQDGIIQAMISALAEEMTRKWYTLNGDAQEVAAWRKPWESSTCGATFYGLLKRVATRAGVCSTSTWA